MDWAHPERAWGSSLELPVLRALWRAGSALTGQETHRVTGVGTYGGVRYALERLQRQGLVTGRTVGGSRLFALNREHLSYPALEAAFARLDPLSELRERVEALAARHYPARDVSVALFGSVARGDAGPNSDLDLLVVAPYDDDRAAALADELETSARAWTGGPVQVLVHTPRSLEAAASADDPLVVSLRRDARVLVGPSIGTLETGS
jgi:predicted nucleotidyltransferase